MLLNLGLLCESLLSSVLSASKSQAVLLKLSALCQWGWEVCESRLASDPREWVPIIPGERLLEVLSWKYRFTPSSGFSSRYVST